MREFVSPETPIKLIIYQSSVDLLLISNVREGASEKGRERERERAREVGEKWKKLSFFDKLSKSCFEWGEYELFGCMKTQHNF